MTAQQQICTEVKKQLGERYHAVSTKLGLTGLCDIRFNGGRISEVLLHGGFSNLNIFHFLPNFFKGWDS
jgi:hypothetical protein